VKRFLTHRFITRCFHIQRRKRNERVC